MKRTMRETWGKTAGASAALGLAVGLLLAAPGGASAQEPAPPRPDEATQEPPHPEGIDAPLGGGGQESPMEILERIGTTLRRVEDLLAKVSFGAESRSRQEAVIRDLDRLLEQTGTEQQQVIHDIDELIRQARRQGRSQCFSRQSLSQKPSSGEKQQENKGRRPLGLDQKKDRMRPDNSSKAGRPEAPQQSREHAAGRTRPKDPPGERSWSKDTNGIWGLLPQAIHDYIFQGDPSKFPPRYRELLEKYYKRLADTDK